MKKSSCLFVLFLFAIAMRATGTDYYVSPYGSDSADGSIDHPFATLKKAINSATAGSTIYLREGTYTPTTAEAMGEKENIYSVVYLLSKSGAKDKPITITAYEDEKVTFDLSSFKPDGKRVSGFYVVGNYWHLKKFDIVGCQVTIKGHTQSENISLRGGSNCIIERVNIHDGMGNGVLAIRGSNNLVLNCDAYNNYDSFSGSTDGDGGNTDGFGFHLNKATYTGNVIRGCRAWRNSDDGIDLISNFAPVVVDSCWVWENGYDANLVSRGDGNGIKGGGYGMGEIKSEVQAAHNIIRNCIAWKNKQGGFYANHHLGGNDWLNNSAYKNSRNFFMVNRQSWQSAVDVAGYDHVVKSNVSFGATKALWQDIDQEACIVKNNTFLPTAITLTASDFESLEGLQLRRKRNADGSLPEITFLKLKSTSIAYTQKMGYQFSTEESATVEDNDVSGIADITIPTEVEGSYYILQGVRIEKPTTSGLYIVNGKKVVVKSPVSAF